MPSTSTETVDSITAAIPNSRSNSSLSVNRHRSPITPAAAINGSLSKSLSSASKLTPVESARLAAATTTTTIHQPKVTKPAISSLLQIPGHTATATSTNSNRNGSAARISVNGGPIVLDTADAEGNTGDLGDYSGGVSPVISKNGLNLPTIRTEGASPTSPYGHLSPGAGRTGMGGGAGTIKEARSRRKKPWRKLMSVKQNYPDNYTDATFLESLQRNVNFRAYDFWHLAYDTTIVIQHLSTVVTFVCVFIAISTGKIDPETIAKTSMVLTVVGWLIWDEWSEKELRTLANNEGKQQADDEVQISAKLNKNVDGIGNDTRGREFRKSSGTPITSNLAPNQSTTTASRSRSKRRSSSKRNKSTARSEDLKPSPTAPSSASDTTLNKESFSITNSSSSSLPRLPSSQPLPPPTRLNRGLKTLKSAGLIYSTLLGLSPILKSLTKTTTSDSIWALSSWLFLVNLLCFDYGLNEDVMKPGGEGAVGAGIGPGGINPLGGVFSKKLPTSLSTTTALTASVVLASRLNDTTAVFSLLLFSIQIFGLFPLFRRRLRHLYPQAHITLTITAILTTATLLWFVLDWVWSVMWLGLVLGGGGGAAWVLMGLQRYKNEIRGPWDPARPVFRTKVLAD